MERIVEPDTRSRFERFVLVLHDQWWVVYRADGQPG